MLKVVSYSVEEDRQCVVVEHLWLLTAGSEGPKKVLKWEGGGCLSMDEGQRGAEWFRELMENQLIVVNRGGVRAALGADEQTALQGS